MVQPVMQVATECILRVRWVPASQERTYPVPCGRAASAWVWET